jgi:hypothetical protein
MTDNGAGSLFLLTLGTVLVALAGVADRIELESFEFFGAHVKVRDVVRSRLDVAAIAGPGDVQIRQQALTLQKLSSLYQLYQHVRAMEPASDERTSTLDEIASQMQMAAQEAEFDPADVSIWFHDGTDALRVMALNIMLSRKECRDFTAVIEAIDEPRSLFEQYYAMRLGFQMTGELDWLQQRLLRQALVRASRRRAFRRDEPLTSLRDSILVALGTRGTQR